MSCDSPCRVTCTRPGTESSSWRLRRVFFSSSLPYRTPAERASVRHLVGRVQRHVPSHNLVTPGAGLLAFEKLLAQDVPSDCNFLADRRKVSGRAWAIAAGVPLTWGRTGQRMKLLRFVL